MNGKTVRELGEALKPVLAEFAEVHGLTVKFGGGKYDPDTGTFTPKIEFSNPDAAEKKFALLAWQVNLEPKDFGREVTLAGKTLKIVGVNPRAHAKPIELVDPTDPSREYRATETSVLRALGR